jgi:signal transduction histidine kinase
VIQVISNLMKNGVEAMLGGGCLTASLTDNHDWMIISILDEGTGIDAGDLEKIFEPFYTTKGIGKGTGLGLATAYGVVKMHRGRIDVKSTNRPEKGPTGTEFIIKLPRKREL